MMSVSSYPKWMQVHKRLNINIIGQVNKDNFSSTKQKDLVRWREDKKSEIGFVQIDTNQYKYMDLFDRFFLLAIP